MRHFLQLRASLILCAALISLGSHSVAAQTYTIRSIAPLSGGTGIIGNAINASGQIVGSGDVANGDIHAFRWGNSSGSYSKIYLGSLGNSTYSAAFGLNDAGWAVGAAWTGNGANYTHAFYYAHGNIHDIGTLSGSRSYAYGINANGIVVGESQLSGNAVYHAFLYNIAQNFLIDMGTLGGGNSSANAINGAGQIVGSAEKANGHSRAFRWTDLNGNGVIDSGEMVNLGVLSGTTDSGASAINASGEVVGMSGNVAFLWKDSNGNNIADPGEMHNLGSLGGDNPAPLGINSSGQIVGSSGTIPNDPMDVHAFLWTPTSPNATTGMMRDLNHLLPPNSGWVLQTATGINDEGQIVGSGHLNNVLRAFRMSPVKVASMTLPNDFAGGLHMTGTVSLLDNAPSGGVTVKLSSSNASVVGVPATVQIPAGSDSATFTLSTTQVTVSTSVSIKAKLNGTVTIPITVRPIGVKSVSVSPNPIQGGPDNTTLCSVYLEIAPTSSDVTVHVGSSNPAVANIPGNGDFTVSPGFTFFTFYINTQAVTMNTPVTITATANGIGRSTSLMVTP